MSAERHRPGEASALRHHARSARRLLPAQTPQTMSAAGGFPHAGPAWPPRKLCSHTGGEHGHQEHHESSRFTLSLKILDHFFAFCIRSQLSDIKEKSSSAQQPGTGTCWQTPLCPTGASQERREDVRLCKTTIF